MEMTSIEIMSMVDSCGQINVADSDFPEIEGDIDTAAIGRVLESMLRGSNAIPDMAYDAARGTAYEKFLMTDSVQNALAAIESASEDNPRTTARERVASLWKHALTSMRNFAEAAALGVATFVSAKRIREHVFHLGVLRDLRRGISTIAKSHGLAISKDVMVSVPRLGIKDIKVSHLPALERRRVGAVAAYMALVLAVGFGTRFTRSTPGAIKKMLALPLPTDKNTYKAYVGKVAAIVNMDTRFHIYIGDDAHAGNRQAFSEIEKAAFENIDDIEAALKARTEVIKQMHGAADMCKALLEKAHASGNPVTIKGAVVTTRIIQMLLQAVGNGGTIERIVARVERLFGGLEKEKE